MGTIDKDPVCGMAVDKKKAAATSEYKGTTYYFCAVRCNFCAVRCKEAFDKDPDKYLKSKSSEASLFALQ